MRDPSGSTPSPWLLPSATAPWWCADGRGARPSPPPSAGDRPSDDELDEPVDQQALCVKHVGV
jgi:hypothetical protein